MLRLFGGVVAGVVAWLVIVTILNLGLRYGWPEYHAVERALTFTLPMMIARLCESGVSSIASGYIAAKIGRNRFQSALGAGVLLVIPFGYYHLAVLWDKFPPWYHLTFLISLVVLSWLGGQLANKRPASG